MIKFIQFVLVACLICFFQTLSANDLRGQKACDKLSTTDAYKSCKVLSVKLHASSDGSASYQVHCNCTTKKDNQPITVTVNMGMY